MTIEFDHRIGKLTSLLIHTLSSFTADEDYGEEYAHSEISGPIVTFRTDNVSGKFLGWTTFLEQIFRKNGLEIKYPHLLKFPHI